MNWNSENEMVVYEAEQSLNAINHRKIFSKAPLPGAFFNLFLPNRCLTCAQPVSAEKILCKRCMGFLEEVVISGTYKSTALIERVYFYDYYDSPLTGLIKAYKYGPHKCLEMFLGLFLSRLLTFWKLSKHIIPVPSHIVSKRKRGFSSVTNIARTCKLAFCPDINILSIVKRKGDYIPQASLSDQKKRRENAGKSYSIVKGTIPQDVLIVDDIMTSGNTLEAIAGLIKKQKSDCRITGAVLVKRGR